MAFDVEKLAGGYGTGDLGNIQDPTVTDNINCYAQIMSLTENSVVLGEISSSQYTSFKEGATIMIHSSLGAAKTLGLYMTCTITGVNNKTLTIDKNPFDVFPTNILTKNTLQAIVSADFDTLTLETKTISPLPFSLSLGYGGILFVRCKTELQLTGGYINLVDKGIPLTATEQQRPATAQETTENIDDHGTYAGWENHITVRKFLLNRGCGAAFIITPYMTCSINSRIGNPDQEGLHYNRGNICGGSTILIAAENIWNFRPSIISKASPTNHGNHPEYGFARCYIASKTKLRNDEGLYAYDSISDKVNALSNLNIRDFGNGSYGSCTNPTRPFNNYARVISIGNNTKQLIVADMTSDGIGLFKVGGLVMVHVSSPNLEEYDDVGRFTLARIEAFKDDIIFLDTAIPTSQISEVYNTQIIAIPEFTDLAITKNYTQTPKWNGKTGGICAVAVQRICDLSDGQLNVMAKGGAKAYCIGGSDVVGNAHMYNSLPLGEGHGSVFILANKLIMNKKTRIGATYSGANFGGCGYNKKYNLTQNQEISAGGGYRGKTLQGTGGWPGSIDPYAGYGSNGKEWKNYGDGIGYHGAHIFIVADTIVGLNQAAISTGGSACSVLADGYCGGAGYGGGSADNEWGANGGGFMVGGGNGANDDNYSTHNANIEYRMVPVYRTEKRGYWT